MLRFDIQGNLDALKRDLNEVHRKHIPAAAAIALNRTGVTVRKVASQEIRKRLALNSSAAKDTITIRRAGRNRLSVEIIASGRPVPLRDYQARETRKGVTFRVSKAGGRKKYFREGRAGFILESKGGHVFVRTEDDPPGSKKGHIKKVYGPSVPQYFVTKAIRKLMDETTVDRFPKELNAAIRGVLMKRTGVDIGAR